MEFYLTCSGHSLKAFIDISKCKSELKAHETCMQKWMIKLNTWDLNLKSIMVNR